MQIIYVIHLNMSKWVLSFNFLVTWFSHNKHISRYLLYCIILIGVYHEIKLFEKMDGIINDL